MIRPVYPMQPSVPPVPPASPELIGGWLIPSNAPGYLAALIAGIALFFAIRSSNASRKNAEAAQKQLARLEESDHRKYAEHMDAWIEKVDPWQYVDPSNATNKYGDEIGGTHSNAWVVRVAVHNQGKEAIRRLALEISAIAGTMKGEIFLLGVLDRIPPSPEPVRYVFNTVFRESEPEMAKRASLAMRFRDARDVWWSRDWRGGLSELEPGEWGVRHEAQIMRSDDLAEEIGLSNEEHDWLFDPRPYTGSAPWLPRS